MDRFLAEIMKATHAQFQIALLQQHYKTNKIIIEEQTKPRNH